MAQRGSRIATGFMAAWIVLWTAGMLVVLYSLAGALWNGDWAAAGVMALWLAGAGLFFVTRRLIRRARPGLDVPRPAEGHVWKDGLEDPR